MMIHISLGGFIAIHAEGAWAYGKSPAWNLSRFREEFVLDIPFCRIILTPGKIFGPLYAKQCSFNRVGWNRDETEKPWDADQIAAGTAEDRS